MAISKKVCIVGAFAVGKTSLVRRYVLNEFSHDYHATLGVNVYKYVDQIVGPDGRQSTVNQILWDIEGSQQRSEIVDTYLRGASGALVVGDITRPDALDSMASHADHFLRIQPGRALAFALNKADLLEPTDAARRSCDLAERYSAEVLHTSAATGASVPELFRSLACRILEIGA